MTRKQSLTPEEQWQNFWIAMAELDFSLTDEEVLAEVRADGEDPDQIAAEVHDALMRGFHTAQRRKLDVAAQKHAEQVAELAPKNMSPPTPEGHHALLAAVFVRQPSLKVYKQNGER